MVAPKVSIIVPVYNMERYLAHCLDSLLGQHLSEIEVICVNDKSTDNSLNILREYQSRDERIVVIDLPENRKQGGARNAGLQVARAAYVGFVDSDDWVSAEMYQLLYATATAADADMATCDYYYYYGEQNMRLQINLDASVCTLPPDERNKHILLNGARLVTCILRKSLFSTHQLAYPEQLFYEDNAIASALYLSAKQVVKVEGGHYYYRQNNISTTRSRNNYRFFDRLETSRLFLAHLRRLGFYDRYREEVEFRFTELFFVNSILGAVSQFTPPEKEYTHCIKREMLELFPHFRQNPHYRQRIPLKIRTFLALILFNTQLGVTLYRLFMRLK